MDDAKTVWCGNLADQVTEELLYELFLQVAPLERVKIPIDREGRKSNFGFVTFKHEVSVPYAVQLLNGIKMFDKNLNVKPRNGGAQQERQRAEQNAVQRSFSYPNDAYNQNRYNQHKRFNESSDMGPQYVSYDQLVQLGQILNVNHNYQDSPFDNLHEIGQGSSLEHNNRNNRQQWERHNYEDRERSDYDRPRKGYERERGRRNNDHSNRNRKNNDRHNHNYDRNGERRNRRFF